MQFISQSFIAHIFDIAGVAGFCIYVTAYLLLTTQVLTSKCISYFVLNLCASSLVMFSLIGAFNLATMMIQLFWIVISIIAIWTRIRGRKQARDVAAQSFERLQQASTAGPLAQVH